MLSTINHHSLAKQYANEQIRVSEGKLTKRVYDTKYSAVSEETEVSIVLVMSHCLLNGVFRDLTASVLLTCGSAALVQAA